MGYLTTHILDTANGSPASNVTVSLYELTDGKRVKLTQATTNEDGRCNQPLLNETDFHKGIYQLEFSIGDYFRTQNTELIEPLFLDDVVIRFGINDESSHYHVPVLISPYGYSTYRGS